MFPQSSLNLSDVKWEKTEYGLYATIILFGIPFHVEMYEVEYSDSGEQESITHKECFGKIFDALGPNGGFTHVRFKYGTKDYVPIIFPHSWS